MDISIERRQGNGREGPVVELVLVGRIDAESAAEIEHAVSVELARGGHAIRLDCEGVSFLSSAGIRVLFNVHRAAKAVGGRCLVGAASDPVAKVLELTRLAPILMEPRADARAANGSRAPGATAGDGVSPAGPESDAGEFRSGSILFVDWESAGGGVLEAALAGPPDPLRPGSLAASVCRRVPRHAFGLGLGALSEASDLPTRAGELLAACGTVFHRPPQPFAAVDYSLGEGSHVPSVRFASGLFWEGLPRGRAGFEPADDEPAVPFDTLAAALLERSQADCLAVVVVAEVQGLVGVELIRPLAEMSAEDHPRSLEPAVVARWLGFSREPVHQRHTALVVGVIVRGGKTGGPIDAFVRPLAEGSPAHGHAHAAVFPLRPLRRGTTDLAAAVADLAASEPLAVMHLLADPQPVLGSGRSEFVRGCCWFAPLSVGSGAVR